MEHHLVDGAPSYWRFICDILDFKLRQRMRVAIIGGGTGGVVSALSLVSRSLPWMKFDLIHDPNIPIFGVGEALSHDFVNLIRNATQFSPPFDLEKLNAKIKQGIMFIDWQENQNYPQSTSGYIPLSTQGLHVDTFALKDYALPRLKHYFPDKFREVEGNVSKIWQDDKKAYLSLGDDTLEYDFIIDARGTPKDIDDTYERPTSIPVDSAVLNVCSHPGDWDFTYAMATRDGWCFGIPVHQRSTWGYTFNRSITSDEEAIRNCHEFLHTHRIPKKHINYNTLKENFHVLKWDHYHSKKIADGRILRNGSMLFQYEPLHGYSVPLFTTMATQFLEYFSRDMTEEDLNANYLEYMDSFGDLIAFHYHKGSIYDTPFWKHASEISTNQLQGSEWMKICLSECFTFEDAANMEDFLTTAPIAHPMFIWEIDKAFNFGYFNHIPDHHTVIDT